MRIEYPRPLFYASTKKRQVLVNEDDAGELYRWYPPNEKRNNRDAVKNVYLSVESTETTFTIEQKSAGFLKEQQWLVTENEREIGVITVPNSLNPMEHRLNGRLNVQDASIDIEIKAEKLRKGAIFINGVAEGETYLEGGFLGFNKSIVIDTFSETKMNALLLTALIHTYWCSMRSG